MEVKIIARFEDYLTIYEVEEILEKAGIEVIKIDEEK